jgi:WD40 repeat protein/transcriptional regulator with XRE-family HTH domain
VAGQPSTDFAWLLRQLRAEAGLTQEELAQAAGLGLRTVSDLERGAHRTAQQDTARLLADALGLAEPVRGLFVAAARGRVSAAAVMTARSGLPREVGGLGGSQAEVERLLGAVTGSPYCGLKAFGEQDALFFFGREAATVTMVERMSRLVEDTGLLVVSGVSGAGKSSLLQAGVLPRIRKGGLAGAPEAASWPCLLFTPTNAPLDELALRAGLLAGVDAATVRRGLDADPAGFALTLRQAALTQQEPKGDTEAPAQWQQAPQQPRVVLVVDQFEQVFTLCADERQRLGFITALHAAATIRHGPDQAPAGLVVLGMRADFEARCADYPQLAGAVQERYLVTAMTERQLRMAITEPAKKAGSPVDDDLAEVLLSEARAGQPGASRAGVLPLLSHALDQAWRNRAGNAVTLADYERTGGIEGAVASSAQSAYDALTPAQQTVARQVFTRLAATSSDGIDTADRADRADLTAGKTAAETADVDQVLEAFATERLLTLAAGTVELSHEILLTAWPLLRDTWLADTHADRIIRTRLQHTATDWDHHHRDPSYLYTGTLLATATGTTARITADPARHPPLSPAETDFLQASDRAHHRRARRRQAVIAGLLALTLAAVTSAGIAAHNAATAAHNAASARRQHTLALSRQLAAESLSIASINPVIARQLAVAAWRVFPTDLAGSVMATFLAGQEQGGILPADVSGAQAVAFSPNGKLLATGGDDGTVRLWSPATGQAVSAPLHAAGARGAVWAVAFSPNGKLLATGNSIGTVRLWDLVTGRLFGKPLYGTRSLDGVYAVAFSPDGKLLASANGDDTVRLWNPATGQPTGAPLRIGGRSNAEQVVFSPNGKLLATVDAASAARLWEPATGKPVGALLHGVWGVGFSPSSKVLVSVSAAGEVRFRYALTGQPIGVPLRTGSQPDLSGEAFSRNGKLLATGNSIGTVRLWDLATGRPIGKPFPPPVPQTTVNVLALSPDRKLLAIDDSDGIVLWDLATGRPVGAPLQAGGTDTGEYGVAFSPNGKLLASASDGTVRLWNPATGQPAAAPLPAPSAPNGVFWVAFSPNGKLLAAPGPDGVRLWNPATGQPVHEPHRITAYGGVNGVAFSPNGKLLATAGADGSARLWNPVTGQPVRVLHVGTLQGGVLGVGVNGVAFSPNGKLLATAGADGSARLWNPVTGEPTGAPIHVTRVRGGVYAVAFSPNGKLLATAGSHGVVRLWNPVTGRPVGVPLLAHTGLGGAVNAVAFSRTGKLLAIIGSGGTVRLWNPATGQPVGVPLPTGTPGVVGVAFSPNGKLLATAGSDGSIQIWNVSLFMYPYAALCADVGPPTPQEWAKYAPSEPQPKICA